MFFSIPFRKVGHWANFSEYILLPPKRRKGVLDMIYHAAGTALAFHPYDIETDVVGAVVFLNIPGCRRVEKHLFAKIHRGRRAHEAVRGAGLYFHKHQLMVVAHDKVYLAMGKTVVGGQQFVAFEPQVGSRQHFAGHAHTVIGFPFAKGIRDAGGLFGIHGLFLIKPIFWILSKKHPLKILQECGLQKEKKLFTGFCQGCRAQDGGIRLGIHQTRQLYLDTVLIAEKQIFVKRAARGFKQ